MQPIASALWAAIIASALVTGPALPQDNTIPEAAHRPSQPKITYAQILHRVEPDYTPEARAAGLQGLVVLYLLVGPAGQLARADVVQSLGLGLDEKALEAVKQWRFKPGTRDGAPDWVAQCVEIEFRLGSAPSWEITRSLFRVRHPDVQVDTQRPTLQQYTQPVANTCRSDGALVVANVKVNKQGQPSDVKLIEQSGDAGSDAVLDAIRSWRFEPGRLNGKPKEANGRIELECHTAPSGEARTHTDSEPVYRLGPGISIPAVLYKIEPEYSEQARRAKFQGTVVLAVDVDETGHATNVRIARRLGLGLDEKAAEAVYQWRFKPAMMEGHPVKLLSTVEVNFRLL